MKRLCYLAIAVLGALALQTSPQAQECSSASLRQRPLQLGWPYTAQFRARQRPSIEGLEIVAEDAQGRFFHRYTTAAGNVSSTVYDPVAAQEIWWDSGSTTAKVVKYGTPAAGRRTCWQSSWSERSEITGRILKDGYQAFCAPAGHDQPWGCHDACYAERLAKALPPEKKGFPKCEFPGGSAEDLGMSTIQGVEVHGCRTTRPFQEATGVQETWADEYGLILRQVDQVGNGPVGSKELISLSRDEPDLSTFQPPKGYKVVTLEMEEVPCEAAEHGSVVSVPMKSPTEQK